MFAYVTLNYWEVTSLGLTCPNPATSPSSTQQQQHTLYFCGVYSVLFIEKCEADVTGNLLKITYLGLLAHVKVTKQMNN